MWAFGSKREWSSDPLALVRCSLRRHPPPGVGRVGREEGLARREQVLLGERVGTRAPAHPLLLAVFVGLGIICKWVLIRGSGISWRSQ